MNEPLSSSQLRHLRGVAAERPRIGGDRYELLEPLGEGGMGEVWRAYDHRLQRDVALKVLHARHASPEILRRAQREAHVLARLEHPGIVPVHDLGALEDGRVWYAMKLVRGSRLDAWMAEHPGRARRLRVLAQVADAVAFAHDQGIVHRDLKPANVMVADFGEVLVLDWGVAKWGAEAAATDVAEDLPTADTQITRVGTVLGTAGYMAPEQQAGRSAEVDARADVYALGVMLGEVLAEGSRPSPQLRAVQARAVAPAAESRYPHAGAFAEELRRAVDGERVEAFRERPWHTLARTFHRFQALAWVVVAYLVVRWLVYWMTRA